MPRNNTSSTSTSKSSVPSTYKAQDMMSRTSYTGPIMPRPAEPTTFTQNIKQGFSFGIGTSLAQRFVGSLFGSSSTSTPVVVQSATPQITPEMKKDFVGKAPLDVQIAYQQCLKDNADHEKCKEYLI